MFVESSRESEQIVSTLQYQPLNGAIVSWEGFNHTLLECLYNFFSTFERLESREP